MRNIIRACAILLASFFILANISGRFARADFDVATSLFYRSTPLSGAADLTMGYGLVLWGAEPTEQKGSDPFYGYLRPTVTGTGSDNYSGWGYGFELFPISFIGAVAGQNFANNEKDYSAYDCKKYLCRGDFREDYIEAKLALAAWDFFLLGTYRSSHLTEENVTTLDKYISPDNGLAVTTKRDVVDRWRGTLGYKITESWSVIGTYVFAKAERSLQESTHILGGISFREGEVSASLQGGTFESDLKSQTGTAVFSFSWAPLPSVSLF